MSVQFHLRTLLIVIAVIAVLLTPAALEFLVPFLLLALILTPSIVVMLVSTTVLVDRERRPERELDKTRKVGVRRGVVMLFVALTILLVGLVVTLLFDR